MEVFALRLHKRPNPPTRPPIQMIRTCVCGSVVFLHQHRHLSDRSMSLLFWHCQGEGRGDDLQNDVKSDIILGGRGG